MIEARPATRDDLIEFFSEAPAQTVRAWVLDGDNGVAYIAGYHMQGGVSVVFSDAKPGVSKMRIWREAVAFMRRLKTRSVCVTKDSGPFLRRLGWEYVGTSENGDMFQFEPGVI